MTLSLKHLTQSAKTNSSDSSIISSTAWNAEHTLTVTNPSLLGSAAGGAVEELSASVVRDLLDLVPGTDVQAYDADLAAIAGLTYNRGDLIVGGTSAWTDLVLGTSGYHLQSDGTDVGWAGFVPSGTGASTRTWQNKAREIVSVDDFGADNTGVADSATAFTNAIAASKQVFVPPGTYKIGSTVTINRACNIVGAGRDVTTITASSATANVFAVTNFSVTISDIYMNASVTRTAGSYIYVDQVLCVIERVRMDGAYRGITFTGNAGICSARNIIIRNTTPHITASDSCGIYVGGSGTNPEVLVLDNIQMGMDVVVNLPRAGIFLQGCDAATITNSSIIYAQIGLLIQPPSGQGVLSTKLADCFFDNCTTAGMFVTATGTGNASRIWVSNCWFGNAGAGVELDAAGSGATEAVEFHNCHFHINSVAGLLVNNIAFSDVSVIGGVFAQNGIGIDLIAAVDDIKIIGARIGAFDDLLANTTGLRIGGGASDRLMVIGNTFSGNGADVTISAAITGTNVVIDKNSGFTSIYPSLTNHGVLLGQGNSAAVATAAGTSGQALLSGGSGANPDWGTLGAAFGGTGVANNAANTLTFSGNFALTLTLTNTTSLTLPVSGTLAALGGTNAWTAVNTFSNTTDSSSTSTGAIVTSGGIGIAKALTVGTSFAVGTTPASTVGSNLGGTYSGGANMFGVYMGNMTLSPNAAGSAFFQFAGGGTVNTGGNTIALAIGGYFPNITKAGGGTITQMEGIRVDAITGGATNWSIYSLGDVRLGGVVRIDQAPTAVGTGIKTISNAADGTTNLGHYLSLNMNGVTYYIPCGSVALT